MQNHTITKFISALALAATVTLVPAAAQGSAPAKGPDAPHADRKAEIKERIQSLRAELRELKPGLRDQAPKNGQRGALLERGKERRGERQGQAGPRQQRGFEGAPQRGERLQRGQFQRGQQPLFRGMGGQRGLERQGFGRQGGVGQGLMRQRGFSAKRGFGQGDLGRRGGQQGLRFNARR